MAGSKQGKKQHGWWSYDKRVQAITTWLATGNAEHTGAICRVPAGTIRQWRTQDWWKEMEHQLRNEQTLELDVRLKNVVDKALTQVEDRLTNGEYIFNVKTGKVERVPAKLRDIAKVAAESIDKQVILRKFQKDVIEIPKLDDHLKQLAKEFAEIIQGKTNAVHEGREEGLQAGTSVGAQVQAEPGEGPGGAEQGPIDAGAEEGGPEGCWPQESPVEGGSDDPEQSGEAAGGGKSVVRPQ